MVDFKTYYGNPVMEEVGLKEVLEADDSYALEGKIWEEEFCRPIPILHESDHEGFMPTYGKPKGGINPKMTCFKAKIEHGRIAGETICLTPNNQIITELSSHLGACNTLNKDLLKNGFNSIPYPQLIDSRVMKVCSAWCCGNYYHFVIDALPMIEMLNEYTVDNIYFPLDHRYHREYAELLGIGKERIIPVAGFSHLQFRELVCCSIHVEAGRFVYTKGINVVADSLRRMVAPAGVQAFGGDFERIYISRNDSAKRRITNEAQLLDFLISRGFRIVELSKLGVKEQIKLFSQARFVVGGHGAGFTNGIYSLPGTKFIEITHEKYIDCGPIYAVNRNHDMLWATVIGKKSTEGLNLPPTVNEFLGNQCANIEVDMNKFIDVYTMLDKM